MIVTPSVHAELLHPGAPTAVRAWAAGPPVWLVLVPTTGSARDDAALRKLDDGEADAIALALTIGADLVLIDDRAGVAVARAKGLAAVGTLGILDRAASRGLSTWPVSSLA